MTQTTNTDEGCWAEAYEIGLHAINRCAKEIEQTPENLRDALAALLTVTAHAAYAQDMLAGAVAVAGSFLATLSTTTDARGLLWRADRANPAAAMRRSLAPIARRTRPGRLAPTSNAQAGVLPDRHGLGVLPNHA